MNKQGSQLSGTSEPSGLSAQVLVARGPTSGTALVSNENFSSEQTSRSAPANSALTPLLARQNMDQVITSPLEHDLPTNQPSCAGPFISFSGPDTVKASPSTTMLATVAAISSAQNDDGPIPSMNASCSVCGQQLPLPTSRTVPDLEQPPAYYSIAQESGLSYAYYETFSRATRPDSNPTDNGRIDSPPESGLPRFVPEGKADLGPLWELVTVSPSPASGSDPLSKDSGSNAPSKLPPQEPSSVAHRTFGPYLDGSREAKRRSTESLDEQVSPSQHTKRHGDHTRKVPIPMNTAENQVEAMALYTTATWAANKLSAAPFNSPKGVEEANSGLHILSWDDQDKIYAFSKLLKHNIDGVIRDRVDGLSANASDNKQIVANSKTVIFVDCFPSTGYASENPLLHSSDSTHLGTWTSKTRPARVSARYKESCDVQAFYTFGGRPLSEAVAQDEQKNYIEVLDLNKEGSIREQNRKDVLFAKGIGGCPRKRSYLCVLSRNIPYHTPMIPATGALLAPSSEALDIMEASAHSVRSEKRRVHTAGTHANASDGLSKQEKQIVQERFIQRYRSPEAGANSKLAISMSAPIAAPRRPGGALEGMPSTGVRPREQNNSAAISHEHPWPHVTPPHLKDPPRSRSMPPGAQIDRNASDRDILVLHPPPQASVFNGMPNGAGRGGKRGGGHRTQNKKKIHRNTFTGLLSDVNHLDIVGSQGPSPINNHLSASGDQMHQEREVMNRKLDDQERKAKKRKLNDEVRNVKNGTY